MESARQKRLRWTYGVLASVVLNAVLISTVAFQQATVRPMRDTDDRAIIRATLVVLPKASPAARRRDKTLPPQPKSLAIHVPPPATDRKAETAPPPPTAKPAAPPPGPAAPSDEADVRERVGKALRGLNACAKFEVGPQDHQKPPCGKAWAAPGLAIDPVSPELRAQIQAEKSRSDDAVAVGNRFRQDLRDHAGQGDNAHFGCSIDTGGKVKCSTY